MMTITFGTLVGGVATVMVSTAAQSYMNKKGKENLADTLHVMTNFGAVGYISYHLFVFVQQVAQAFL